MRLSFESMSYGQLWNEQGVLLFQEWSYSSKLREERSERHVPTQVHKVVSSLNFLDLKY